MAETFLSPVIEKLVELLAKEVYLLKRVHREVKSLKNELEIIQPFLRDAEAKLEKGEVSDATEVWLQQIREEAERIEDVVDEYLYHLPKDHRQSGFTNTLCKAGHFVKSMKSRYDIASEMQDVKESLREIKDRGKGYGLRPFEQGLNGTATSSVDALIDPRLGSLFIDENDLVGIDSMSKQLVRSLVEGLSTRTVISLVGEGGIGKTTLAKKVYDEEVMKGHFNCYAWITVSQSCNIGNILKALQSQICPSNEQPLRVEELIDLLKNYLKTKRYVIVFDDVWQRDFWDVIKYALPSNDKGSRIIITTRNTSIAYSIKETPYDVVQELKAWSFDLAWLLFCKKAFYFEFEGHCPQELEQLSREIVSKCHGLPLVIVAIAGLLSTKEKKVSEWQRVLDNINYEFENNPQLTNVSKVLSFSYHDLPYHLKSCFLYFGIFPEDYSIFDQRLYRLWIAEGFITVRGEKTSEQVAEEYLNELIHRNMVSFEIQYGFQRWCRVHDLMRDNILRIADKMCFFQILNRRTSTFKRKSRRLSVYSFTKEALKRVENSRIRSILFFNIDEMMTKSLVISLFEIFKLLKVLDFSDAPLDNLPKEVGNLFHLKYLSLNGTNVKMLPKSIGKLHNLQTLNLVNTLVQELPVEIKKLRNLQGLSAYGYFHKEIEFGLDSYFGVRIHEGIGCLAELQTLTFVESYVGRVGFVKELEKLTKLKSLGIGKLTTGMGRALGAAIEKLNCLEELFITSVNEEEIFDSEGILSPPPFLHFLSLRCRLQNFPDWISKLQELRGLTLRFSRLINTPLNGLENLPNLEFLRLYQAFDGEELHFKEGGFQKLKNLKLRKLRGLKMMRIDRGALPLLEELDFGPFPVMMEMSADVQHLSNLKSLRIMDMPREFVAGLQPDRGPHYWKIQHVPSVTLWYTNEGQSYDVYKLDECLQSK